MSDGGKGHAPRPFSVPREQFDANYEAIYGKRERQQYVPPPLPQENQDNDKEQA